MRRKLFKHQIKAQAYLAQSIRAFYGGVLFMQMRLGKTLVMLRELILHNISPENPCLIVCPNTVKDAWIDEFDKEEFYDFIIVDGSPKKKKELLGLSCSFFIVSYQSLESLDIHLYKWGAIILDESIAIAGVKGDASKYIMRYLRSIPLRFVLSGSPAPENELQYFNQIAFVFGSFMGCGSYWGFRLKYFNQVGHKWYPKSGFKKEMYIELRKLCFLLTRNEAGIGSKKLYRKIEIPITVSQRNSYNSMLTTFEADGIDTKYAPVKFLYMQKIAGGIHLSKTKWHSRAKFEYIRDLIKGELKGQKVLVWFKFRDEQYECNRVLEQAGIKTVLINGLTPVSARRKIRLHFRDTPSIPAALLTIKAMKAGTDWSCADTAIYNSNEPSWELRSQSEDRLIHPDIKTPKLIIDLCTYNSYDYDICDILQGKKGDQEFFMSELYGRVLARGVIT